MLTYSEPIQRADPKTNPTGRPRPIPTGNIAGAPLVVVRIGFFAHKPLYLCPPEPVNGYKCLIAERKIFQYWQIICL